MEKSQETEPQLPPIDDGHNNSKKMYGIKWWDIWALGVTLVVGGDYFSWNVGLTAGFGSFVIAALLMGFAYICLCLSVSELSSALPFAGGAYGLARCTMGFFPGFLIGASETIEYVFYVAVSVNALTGMISSLNSGLIGYEPLVWFLIYFSICLIYIYGGKWFWRFNFFLAAISLLILLFYCFGSMTYVNLPKYGSYASDSTSETGWFIGGANNFMLVFPLAAWFYVGIESLNMACDDIEEPKKNIPKGQISCILTLFVTGMLTLIVSSGLPPNISNMASAIAPLSVGFQLMFNTASEMVLILSIPATFATAYGFVYAFSKMISAMGESKLWPDMFGLKHPETGAPFVGIIFGCLLSFLACLASKYNPTFSATLFNVCILAGFVAYVSQCFGYIMLQTKYSNLPREYRSPLGIYGAVFALCVFILGIICVIFFQEDNYLALSIYVGILGLLSVYYFIYASSRQTISEEERKILFVTHVINNSRKCIQAFYYKIT